MAKWKHRNPPVCPDLRVHYVTEVSEGDIDVAAWAEHLNERYAEGYRLAHVIQQGDRTIRVFEHYLHASRRDIDGEDDE